MQAIGAVTSVADDISKGTEATTAILQQILTSAHNLHTLAGKIDATSEQQSVSVQQVSHNMVQLQGLSQDNERGIELVTASSQSLVRTARDLLDCVNQLR